MISLEGGECGGSGIVDLAEAISIAKEQGIVNVKGAIHEGLVWDLFSLSQAVGLGMVDIIPDILESTHFEGVSVHALNARCVPAPLLGLLETVENQVITTAGPELPGWKPTESLTGVRAVSMRDGARFGDHTDDYEGLVASIQLSVQGQKIMSACVRGKWEEAIVQSGDLTLFAGDTFSNNSRVMHGFQFSGAFAVACTLGQDPFYTISGNFPLLNENPDYLNRMRS